MVWLPDDVWMQQKGKGGGGGKGWSGGGGGGKGWSPWQPQFMKMDWGKGFGGGKGWGKGKGKNKRIDPVKTVWIGNLPAGTTYQELKTHGESAGTAKWAEVFKGKGEGTGAIGYATAEEATAAIGILNGTVLKGQPITTDTWAKKEK